MARQPDIATIHPPQEGQDRQGAQNVTRGMGWLQEMGDLGDRKDEGQIEEEFNRRRVPLTRPSAPDVIVALRIKY